jgi:hypothetical protein
MIRNPDEWEQRNRSRPWRPPQQFAHRQCVFFSLASFGVGAFLTLPRAKPDDTAAERRSISASRNALAINVILKAAMASPPQIARASCTSSSIASAAVGEGFARVLTRGSLMRSPDNWKGRAVLRSSGIRRLQPPALAECRKINSGRRVPSRRAIACAKLHRDGLVAIRNPQ